MQAVVVVDEAHLLDREAICKVNDKFNQYPPTKNRIAWFRMVFEEKLIESRADKDHAEDIV